MKTPQQILQDAREEKSLVGKNVHSVYTYCLSCNTWGVNMPLNKVCGNCNKDTDTYTYYDIKTILLWYTSTLQAFLEAEITLLMEKKFVIDEEYDGNRKLVKIEPNFSVNQFIDAQILHFKELLVILSQ